MDPGLDHDRGPFSEDFVCRLLYEEESYRMIQVELDQVTLL